jgi:site-specific DNA recombinase
MAHSDVQKTGFPPDTNALYGYRYVKAHDGGGQARFEPISEQVGVAQSIFERIGRERCMLGEVCRRLQRDGKLTATGKRVWSRQNGYSTESRVSGDCGLRKDAYDAANKEISATSAPRDANEPRRSKSAIAVDQPEWRLIPARAIIGKPLFAAAQEQLCENRTRVRLGLRRPGHLPSGTDLLCSVDMRSTARRLAREGEATA